MEGLGGRFEHDGVFFARVKVRFFGDANGITFFLTLLPLRRRRTLRLSAAAGNNKFRISLTIASNHNCNLSNQARMVMTLSRPPIVVRRHHLVFQGDLVTKVFHNSPHWFDVRVLGLHVGGG